MKMGMMNMRKLICLIMMLMLCCSMVLPVAAAKNSDFVPSITYKDGPDTEKVIITDGNKTTTSSCVITTTLKEAAEKTTDISQEERDLLEKLYKSLKDGSMKLAVDSNFVIWELFDLNFELEGCRDQHDHEEILKKEGNTLTVTFDLGIKSSEVIIVMSYVDGKWVPVKATNNGDGTLTCEFENLGPVVFCRKEGYDKEIPKTGDPFNDSMILWGAALAVSAAVIAELTLNRRKFVR